MNKFLLFGSVVFATQMTVENDTFDFEFESRTRSLDLTTTVVTSDTKRVSMNSVSTVSCQLPSDPRRRKKSKKSCLDLNFAQLSISHATLIDPNQDAIGTLGMILRLGLRKSFKIYAAIIFSLMVVWLDPWLFGHTNPVLFAAFAEFLVAMVRRTPTEVALCDRSLMGLGLVMLMKAETLLFHSIVTTGIRGDWGLRSWHVALLFFIDLYLGLKLNSNLVRLADEITDTGRK